MPIGRSDAALLPIEPGAYLLLIQLDEPVPLPPRFDKELLPKGRYGYAGSAYGPGGIRARCRRHLTRPAKRRWHIDWLTRRAIDVQVIPFPGGKECHLVDHLLTRARIRFPINGFGSTDCRHCPAHLVQFEAGYSWEDLGSALPVPPSLSAAEFSG